MPVTYKDIRKQQEELGLQDMDTAEFAQLLNQVSGTREFDAGKTTGLGGVLKGLNYGLDSALESSRIPEFLGAAGEYWFGDTGREVGESIPRMLLDMAPLAAGHAGIAASAALSGSNIYTQTDSPMAGVVGAGINLALPSIGRKGADLATRGGEKLLGKTFERTAPLAWESGGKTLALTEGKQLVSKLARANAFAGSQVAQLAGNIGQQATTEGIAYGWEGFKNAFTPESLLANAVTQGLFAPLEAHSTRGGRQEVEFDREYGQMLRDYDKNTLQPRAEANLIYEAEAELQARLSARRADAEFRMNKASSAFQLPEQTAGGIPLPAVSGVPVVAGPVGFDTVGNALYSQSTGTSVSGTGVAPNPHYVRFNEAKQTMSVVELHNSTDPTIRFLADNEILGRTPESIDKGIEVRLKEGMKLEDAADEMSISVHAKADKFLRDEAFTAARRAAGETKALQNQSSRNAVLGIMFAKSDINPKAPEFESVFGDAYRKLGPDSSPAKATALQAKAVQWWAREGPEGTPESLAAALKQVTGSGDRAKVKGPTLHRESLATVEAAKLRAAELQQSRPEFAWTSSGKEVFAREYDIVKSDSHLLSSIGEPDLANNVKEAQAEPTKAPVRDEEHTIVEATNEALTTDSFVQNHFNEAELTLLGDGDLGVGQARAAALLDATVAGSKGLDNLVRSGLWDSPEAIIAGGKLIKDKVRTFVQQKAGIKLAMMGEGGVPVLGELQTLGKMLESVGLADPRVVPEAARLAAMMDLDQFQFAQLHGTDAEAVGIFTRSRTGQQVVGLNAAVNSTRAKMFGFAHELIGHGLWSLADQGLLPAHVVERMKRFSAMVGENSAAENQLMLKELWDHLPKQYKKDPDLRKVVQESSADPEEVLANFNAIIALKLAHGPSQKGRWTELMRWLPKPLTDWIQISAQYLRKFGKSLSGLWFARDNGWTPGKVDPTLQRAMHEHIDTLKTVLQSDGVRDAEVTNAIRLQMASSSEYLNSAIQEHHLFTDNLPEISQNFTLKMGFSKKQKEGLLKEVGKASMAVDHFMLPLMLEAQKYPRIRETLAIAPARDARTNQLLADATKVLGLELKGYKWKSAPNNPVLEVAKVPKLAEARDQLVRRANEMSREQSQTVADLLLAKDPETLAILNRLDPVEQTVVKASIIQQQLFQGKLAEIAQLVQSETNFYNVAKAATAKDPTLSNAKAEDMARRATASVESGTPLPVGDPAADLVPYVQLLQARTKERTEQMNAHPEFVSERRFGKYAARVFHSDGRPKYTKNFKTEAELDAFRLSLKSDPSATVETLSPDRPYTGRYEDSALELLSERELEMRPQFLAALESAGVDRATALELIQEHSVAADVQTEIAAKNVPTFKVHRKFVQGREELDMMQQQLDYGQLMVRALTKGTANAEMGLRLADPELRGTPQAQNIKQAWKNFNTPDTKITRTLNAFNYFTYLSTHFLNMMQDTLQPLLGALPASLIGDGGGIVNTGKGILRSLVDVKRKNLPKEEQHLLKQFREGNRGVASYSNEFNNELLTAIQGSAIKGGKAGRSLPELLQNVIQGYMLWSMGLHKHFTDHAMEAGLLASYRHFRKKGLNEVDAQKSAFAMNALGMGAAGKGGRAVGIWNSGRLQPLSAMMTSLQTFALTQAGTWKNFAEVALGLVPDITPTQRVNAAKAFGTHTGVMLASAGVLGLPLVGAMQTIVDKMFGVNSQEWLANLISGDEPLEDDEDDFSLTQLALHGAVNAFGGYDYASRGGVPGVMGLNMYDGFSAEALLGPTYGAGKKLVQAASSAVQGNVVGTIQGLAPNNIGRALKFWKDDHEFRRADGSLVANSTPGDKAIYSLLGVKPTNVSRELERDKLQKINSTVEGKDKQKWLSDMVQSFEDGDFQSLQQNIYERAQVDSLSPLQTQAKAKALANAVVENVMERQTPRDSGRQRGASAGVDRAVGLTSQQQPEVERLQVQAMLLAQLGFSQPRKQLSNALQRATTIDQLRASQPWLTYMEAQTMADSLSAR